MLFNTIQYVFFFTFVFFTYHLIAHRFRWPILLILSYYFYMCWMPEYIFLILTTTAVGYVSAIGIERSLTNKGKRFWLAASLVVTLGILFSYKYLDFFSSSIVSFLSMSGHTFDSPALKLILPVGISFYTFQVTGYVVDVYRGDIKAYKHPGRFALFVSFFPQLVAGPIERAKRLLPQFERNIPFDYANVTDGLKLIAWGLFKKTVIADRLSIAVTTVYSAPTDGFSGIHFIVATLFFAIQIYCDFSGYSDIAIGSAQALGFSLMDNFNRPYHAKNIQDFWRRWHISLSTWFRDYVYIPLGGNRKGEFRTNLNLLATFLLCGLWHGADWTFVTWGGLIGLYMVLYRVTRKIRERVSISLRLETYPLGSKYISIVFTFIMVCFAWIFFRAHSLSDALYISGNIFTGLGPFLGSIYTGLLRGDLLHSVILPEVRALGYSGYEFSVAIGSIAFLETVHVLQRHGGIRHMLAGRPLILRWALYYALVGSIVIFGKFGFEEFIYFRF